MGNRTHKEDPTVAPCGPAPCGPFAIGLVSDCRAFLRLSIARSRQSGCAGLTTYSQLHCEGLVWTKLHPEPKACLSDQTTCTVKYPALAQTASSTPREKLPGAAGSLKKKHKLNQK